MNVINKLLTRDECVDDDEEKLDDDDDGDDDEEEFDDDDDDDDGDVFQMEGEEGDVRKGNRPGVLRCGYCVKQGNVVSHPNTRRSAPLLPHRGGVWFTAAS